MAGEEQQAQVTMASNEPQDIESLKPTGRAWPLLPPLYKLPSDPDQLQCQPYLTLWGECISPSWILRGFYHHGTVGFHCTERWENLRTCVMLKFQQHDKAQKKLNEILEERERRRGPHVWEFRESPPEYFKKFDC